MTVTKPFPYEKSIASPITNIKTIFKSHAAKTINAWNKYV